MKHAASLLIFFACLPSLITNRVWAEAAPNITETIEVTARPFLTLKQRYRQAEGVFRRFDTYPVSDRAGLTLHMEAKLMPGARSGADSGLMIVKGSTRIPLFPFGGDRLVFPHDQALWDANPHLSAKLGPDETLDVGFFFTIAPADPSRFTAPEARHWLAQLDSCIEDEGGFIVASLLPNTHRLTVNVAPGSRFSVSDHGQTRILVDNQSADSYALTIRPQDYTRDAVFQATRPLSGLVMHLPFRLRGKLTRK